MVYLRLHHVNVTSDNMSILTEFYGNALGLTQLPSPAMIATSKNADKDIDGDAEWDSAAKFFEAGDPNELQIHATQRQPYLAAQEGHSVNPLIGGHFAFRTDKGTSDRKQYPVRRLGYLVGRGLAPDLSH
jgi:glyoxylase I family protein